MSYDVFKSDAASVARRREELSIAHLQSGVRRFQVGEILDQQSDEFAVTIKFGRGVAQVSMGGSEYQPSQETDSPQQDESAADAAFFPRVATGVTINPKLVSPLKGAAYGNKMIGEFIMPCGVCLVIGPGGSGKTPLAHALAGFGTEEYAAVRIGEPLGGYSQSEHLAALSIAQAMVLQSNVVVDSIKDLLASGSNLMKSGISRTVLTTISEWSALANDLGTTLYIPVNPSSDDEAVYSLLIEAAKSNATTVISHRSGTEWDLTSRTGEGLPRVSGARVTFTPQSEILVDGIPTTQNVGRKVNIESGFNAASEVVSRQAIERSIKLHK